MNIKQGIKIYVSPVAGLSVVPARFPLCKLVACPEGIQSRELLPDAW